MSPNLNIVAAIFLAASLASCSSVQPQLDALQQKVHDDIEISKAQASATPPPVVTSTSGDWLAGQPVQIAPPSLPVLKQDVAYHPAKLISLADAAEWITENTGLVVDIARLQTGSKSGSSGMSSSTLSGAGGMSMMGGMNGMPVRQSMYAMTVNYNGPLSGLLDVLSNKASCWWKITNGKAEFFRNETETFYLPAIGRKYTGTNSIVSSIGADTAGSASTTTGATATGATSGASGSSGMSSSGNASSTSEYPVDLWGDIAKQAKIVAAGGQVAVNESVGSVTVTGTPAQVRHVQDWARELTDQLSQQVAITIRIYNVKVKNEDNYNWNPTFLFKSAKGVLNLSLGGPQAPAIASGQTPAGLGISMVSNTAAGYTTQYNGSQLAFKALSSLGRVTERIDQTVVTLNGQPAPLQLANMQGYLASTSVTNTVNVGSTSAAVPGMVTTGFTATFIPRIVNGKVILAMTLNDSSNNGFQTATSGSSTIQTPNIDSDSFQEEVSLTPGDALMLTGVQRDTGSASRNGVGSPNNFALGGGVDNSLNKQIVAVVVTAKIL